MIEGQADNAQNLPMWATWALAGAGGITRICLLKGRGDPLNIWQMIAIIISGCICGGMGATVVVQWIPGINIVSLGVSAWAAGILGMVFAEYIVTLGPAKKGPPQ